MSNVSVTFECDPLPEWGLGVGVAMGVAGSIGINVGQNIQAMGIKSLNPSDYTRPWRSKLWRMGLAIFIVFALTNFSALSLAPASILCPIESIQFVTNVVWNAMVNKMRINRKMKLGVCFALVGTVLTVSFGAPGGCHSPEQMREYWRAFAWWLYLVITLSVAAASFVAHRIYRRREKQGVPPPHPALLPVCYAVYCSLVGGAQLIVHSKMISVLLSVVMEEPMSVFGSWLLYVELVLVLTCGITWGIKLTECLSMYDPLIIIPLMVGTYISFGGIAGGIFFQEFAQLHEATAAGYGGWVLYVGGMLMVLGGLGLIADASIASSSSAVAPPPGDPDAGGAAEAEAERSERGSAAHGASESERALTSARNEAWVGDDEEAAAAAAKLSLECAPAATVIPICLGRTLSTGSLDLPALRTEEGAARSDSRGLSRENSSLRADSEARRRRDRMSREQHVNELLWTPNLLPSPFAVVTTSGGVDWRNRPRSHTSRREGALRRANTWNDVSSASEDGSSAGSTTVPSAKGQPLSSRGSSRPNSASRATPMATVPEFCSNLSQVVEVGYPIDAGLAPATPPANVDSMGYAEDYSPTGTTVRGPKGA